MKICRLIYKGEVKSGVLDYETVYVLPGEKDISEEIKNAEFIKTLSSNEVKFLPPVLPSKIVCVGRNYAEHAVELGNEIPKEPLLFLKAPSAIITDGDEIVIPKQSDQVEHEGELGCDYRAHL